MGDKPGLASSYRCWAGGNVLVLTMPQSVPLRAGQSLSHPPSSDFGVTGRDKLYQQWAQRGPVHLNPT